MKIIFSVLLFLLLPFTSLLAQKEPGERLTESVTKITFIEPGIAHEFPLGKSTTFFLRGGVTATLASDYYDEITGVLFRPFASGSFRTYYNFAKRNMMEKNVARNSANYFALLVLAATSPLNKGTDYDPDFNKALLNTGVVWGLQRNYPSGFSLDLNIGLGYVKAGHTDGLSVIGEINIGWWLGKKNKNRD
ncbi:MAG TPA: hypothetical protein VIZ28_13720 [Chitinophagaceae bacterium]